MTGTDELGLPINPAEDPAHEEDFAEVEMPADIADAEDDDEDPATPDPDPGDVDNGEEDAG